MRLDQDVERENVTALEVERCSDVDSPTEYSPQRTRRRLKGIKISLMRYSGEPRDDAPRMSL